MSTWSAWRYDNGRFRTTKQELWAASVAIASHIGAAFLICIIVVRSPSRRAFEIQVSVCDGLAVASASPLAASMECQQSWCSALSRWRSRACPRLNYAPSSSADFSVVPSSSQPSPSSIVLAGNLSSTTTTAADAGNHSQSEKTNAAWRASSLIPQTPPPPTTTTLPPGSPASPYHPNLPHDGGSSTSPSSSSSDDDDDDDDNGESLWASSSALSLSFSDELFDPKYNRMYLDENSLKDPSAMGIGFVAFFLLFFSGVADFFYLCHFLVLTPQGCLGLSYGGCSQCLWLFSIILTLIASLFNVHLGGLYNTVNLWWACAAMAVTQAVLCVLMCVVNVVVRQRLPRPPFQFWNG